MNLDRLAVRARPRSGWESVDLGILLARPLWWQLAALWLLPAAALFLLLGLIFPGSPNWVIFAVWWMKPAFERLPLLVASRKLFNEPMRNRAALAQFRAANRHDWLAWLTWRRLSFTRAFDLPVTVLEHAQGKTRATRIALLHRNAASTASWLHIVGVHVEMILVMGLAALFYLMLPAQLEIDWIPLVSDNSVLSAWIANGLTLLVMAAVAPFYVCGGFMLYIGRRVELEAWDIEIQFRKLRARLDAQQKRPRKAPTTRAATVASLACAVTLVWMSAMLVPQPAHADIVTPGQAETVIDEVLADEDFHQREQVSHWRLKTFESREYPIPAWFIAFIEWLEGLGGDEEVGSESAFWPLLAGIIEVLLWTTAIALVAYLLWRYRDHLRALLGYRAPEQAAARPHPQTLFGLDVRRESLPEDVTREVLALWQAGHQRDAMGLLYRASLSNLISQFDCAFRDHHTEAECAQLVRDEAGQDPRLQPALVHFFSQLTAVWQRQAYAHQPPARAQLESLCTQWQQVFREREAAS
ncbi:DUF4129 domain-containing protein [Microbulbifer sp. Q7]|uniref:DUF4129 domain-containing protein n=1 Tax=Microbulbifer sp. Q7 TaxID=1785091 RepID=UPI0008335130|nr:DUF4129 domain-containing protein [Microbulbifer sp. Q7]